MKVTIKIDCEDETELLAHLSVIRNQIKKALKNNEEFEGKISDSNCYGDHQVKIADNKY